MAAIPILATEPKEYTAILVSNGVLRPNKRHSTETISEIVEEIEASLESHWPSSN